jgi:hypothetical protein
MNAFATLPDASVVNATRSPPELVAVTDSHFARLSPGYCFALITFAVYEPEPGKNSIVAPYRFALFPA